MGSLDQYLAITSYLLLKDQLIHLCGIMGCVHQFHNYCKNLLFMNDVKRGDLKKSWKLFEPDISFCIKESFILTNITKDDIKNNH